MGGSEERARRRRREGMSQRFKECQKSLMKASRKIFNAFGTFFNRGKGGSIEVKIMVTECRRLDGERSGWASRSLRAGQRCGQTRTKV